MLLGDKPEPRNVAALDAYFVTVCDHGMNASTFTTRVVASTQADLFAAVTAGYCALTGPLHGGAPEPVLEMLDAIGKRERIKPWVDDALARGERLMGFGHRVYRVRDPRADVLKAAIERLSADGADLPFASEVEAYIREALRRKNPDRPLETNVEFFTAILLDALAIPRQAFTPIFAVARAAGWTAHALEQQRHGPADSAEFFVCRENAEDGGQLSKSIDATAEPATPPSSCEAGTHTLRPINWIVRQTSRASKFRGDRALLSQGRRAQPARTTVFR